MELTPKWVEKAGSTMTRDVTKPVPQTADCRFRQVGSAEKYRDHLGHGPRNVDETHMEQDDADKLEVWENAGVPKYAERDSTLGIVPGG